MTAQIMNWTAAGTPWRGEFEGKTLGAGVSIIFNSTEKAGVGPKLHRHPYTETFIVKRGTVIFSNGEAEFEASEGQIVVVPANEPHRFTTKTAVVEMIDIHDSPHFVTEWL